MLTYKNCKSKKLLNFKGETLIELLVSIFILAITLTLIISVFMTGREGIEESWIQTEKNECATNVMEQLKSLPYSTLIDWEKTKREQTGLMTAKDINYSDVITSGAKLQCSVNYAIQLDLQEYNEVSIEEIMEVKVRVRQDENDSWAEIGSLIRKGDESP